MVAQLAKDQKWRPGQWAFDGRKNIYSPDQFLAKEERSYQVSFTLPHDPYLIADACISAVYGLPPRALQLEPFSRNAIGMGGCTRGF